MQTLDGLMQKLAQTGQRLGDLESKVLAIKSRLRFWQVAAGIGIGASILFAIAWLRERERRCSCDTL
jgi:hypothetical protein